MQIRFYIELFNVTLILNKFNLSCSQRTSSCRQRYRRHRTHFPCTSMGNDRSTQGHGVLKRDTSTFVPISNSNKQLTIQIRCHSCIGTGTVDFIHRQLKIRMDHFLIAKQKLLARAIDRCDVGVAVKTMQVVPAITKNM
jgi:hypothetical protein